MRLRSFMAAAALLSASLAAHADYTTTIDFNGLSGPNNSPFVTFSEAGFTVSNTGIGGFFQATSGFGDSAPDIYTNQTGQIAISKGGTPFSFSSFDLGFYSAGNIGYDVIGVFPTVGSYAYPATAYDPNAGTFLTIPNEIPSALLTSVYLDINTTNPTGYIDNIVLVTPSAPEPTSFALLGTGVLGLGALVRKRVA